MRGQFQNSDAGMNTDTVTATYTSAGLGAGFMVVLVRTQKGSFSAGRTPDSFSGDISRSSFRSDSGRSSLCDVRGSLSCNKVRDVLMGGFNGRQENTVVTGTG